MSKNVIEELTELKNKIDRVKTEKAQVEGELKGIKKRMADEFGSDDPKVVSKKSQAMKEQADKLNTQIEEGLAAIRKELE